MKISRHSEKEKSNLNVDWLILFAHELEKKGYLENLKPIINRKKYSSIEEKLDDIKARIGFDMVSKLDDELNKTSDLDKDCGCEGHEGSCSCKIKTAEYKHPEDDVKKMKNVLNYISDMVKAEPHLSSAAVISRCRDTEGLGFNHLRIDHGKLRSFIEDLISKYDKNESSDISYVPRDEGRENDFSNDQADYYSHAKPYESK